MIICSVPVSDWFQAQGRVFRSCCRDAVRGTPESAPRLGSLLRSHAYRSQGTTVDKKSYGYILISGTVTSWSRNRRLRPEISLASIISEPRVDLWVSGWSGTGYRVQL